MGVVLVLDRCRERICAYRSRYGPSVPGSRLDADHPEKGVPFCTPIHTQPVPLASPPVLKPLRVFIVRDANGIGAVRSSARTSQGDGQAADPQTRPGALRQRRQAAGAVEASV
jgi:hypothetical protein